MAVWLVVVGPDDEARLAGGVVVLTVDEGDPAGLRTCAGAGSTDVGRYLGGRSGPQRAMVARCG